MINVLDELRTHLIAENIVTASECKLNVSDESDEQVVLWQYGGFQTDIGQKPTIQIKVMSQSQAIALDKITAIFDELISDSPMKYKKINNTKMWIEANQQPFFLERDAQNREIYIFNIVITAFR